LARLKLGHKTESVFRLDVIADVSDLRE